jgi:MFS family permease
MVIVNTVVLVRAGFGLGASEVAWTLATYGFGSMIAALMLPRLLDSAVSDRTAMLAGAALLVVGLLLGALVPSWPVLLPLWALLGLGNGLVLTPGGRLLRRSAHPGDRPALFAAQFALSHACWLAAYPVAGWLGAAAGMPAAFLALAVLGGVGLCGAWWVWPAETDVELEHDHYGLPPDDAHLTDALTLPTGGFRHRHAFVVDDLHPHWPR